MLTLFIGRVSGMRACLSIYRLGQWRPEWLEQVQVKLVSELFNWNRQRSLQNHGSGTRPVVVEMGAEEWCGGGTLQTWWLLDSF